MDEVQRTGTRGRDLFDEVLISDRNVQNKRFPAGRQRSSEAADDPHAELLKLFLWVP